MPSEEWDEIIARYQEVYLNSRFAENAKGILKLIPRIVADPAFADVVPRTSLTALQLEIPGKKTRILVWSENDGSEYSISLQDNSTYDEQWTRVSDDQIVSVLREHIQRISAE
ncbi:MAG: hypothetical protein KJ065_12900 [Anaerolineae bacterium]|nr:hypothetical protein [Anaerolineae bacterium]